jgi:hypothetical protein
VQVDPAWYLEIVLTSPRSPITHFYRSPFPQSSNIVHLRPARPLAQEEKNAGAVLIMSGGARGFFGIPRDVVLIDGKEPADVKSGVPTDPVTTLRLPTAEVGRPVIGLFDEERIVARAWPAAENRTAVIEIQKIEHDRESPDGRSHLCSRRIWIDDHGGDERLDVFCFIPGSGS